MFVNILRRGFFENYKPAPVWLKIQVKMLFSSVKYKSSSDMSPKPTEVFQIPQKIL